MHAYMHIFKLVLVCMYICECVFFPVCCGLSLTPNSLSLIGCVILWKDKEGHWRGAWGGGEKGSEGACLACSFTGIQRDSHTLSAHRPLLPTLLLSPPTLTRSTKKIPQTFFLGWSCNGIKTIERLIELTRRKTPVELIVC